MNTIRSNGSEFSFTAAECAITALMTRENETSNKRAVCEVLSADNETQTPEVTHRCHCPSHPSALTAKHSSTFRYNHYHLGQRPA